MLNRKRSSREPQSRDTSLIARGTIIRGDLHFTGALHVDGRIEGAIVAEGEDSVLTISDQGQVIGEIRVPHAVIDGRVDGNVLIDSRLELAAKACIAGDVHYRLLEMAAGAQVNGRMVHVDSEVTRELSAPGALAAPARDAELTGSHVAESVPA